MTTQLAMDGTEVAYPVRTPRALTPMQRDVLTFIRAHHTVQPSEVSEAFACQGFGMLLRLRRRGLVERVNHAAYRVVEHDEAWS